MHLQLIIYDVHHCHGKGSTKAMLVHSFCSMRMSELDRDQIERLTTCSNRFSSLRMGFIASWAHVISQAWLAGGFSPTWNGATFAIC